jgi:hypothetical protein
MEFPHEKIEKIAEKIGNMRDKKYKNDLKQIKKIIEELNPEICMTKNNNGYFLPDFESYSCETYNELTKYLEKVEKREKSESFSDTETKKSVYYSEKTDDYKDKNKKLKYTNSENHILNKIAYEKAMKKHQNECNECNEDFNNENKKEHIKIKELEKIFIKKNNDNIENKNITEKIFKKHSNTKHK